MGPHDHCLHSDPLVLSALGGSTEDQYSITRVYGCVRCVHSGPLHYRSWVWILLGTGGVERALSCWRQGSVVLVWELAPVGCVVFRAI